MAPSTLMVPILLPVAPVTAADRQPMARREVLRKTRHWFGPMPLPRIEPPQP